MLRAEQAAALLPHFLALRGPPVTDKAIERYHALTRVVPDESTGRVRRGAFTYEPDVEADRIARGEALIHRVAPGPQEDPNYFAMLAYQAASLEMAAEDTTPGLFDRFVLGTAHSADVNAFSRRLRSKGCTIVVLNSGLIDFVYQSAKVVIEAMHPVRTTGEEKGLVKTSTSPESVREALATDPAPIERLYRTMEAYFFNGYPRASAFETVPEEQHPPLSLVVGFAERWIIGHEYGHGLAPSMANAPDEVNVAHAEEYFADTSAMIGTVLSAAKLDHVAPEFPLGGAIFALACLDLRRRALNILLAGDEHWDDGGPQTHPAPRDRATALINAFRQFFDVEYHPDHLFDLWFMVRSEVPETHGFTSVYREYAYQYATVLQIVWDNTKERLLEDHRQQRPLHPMWA